MVRLRFFNSIHLEWDLEETSLRGTFHIHTFTFYIRVVLWTWNVRLMITNSD